MLYNQGANQTGLFDGLPVVTVRNWEDVTPALLEAEWKRLASDKHERAYSWRRLTAAFYLELVRAAADPH